MTAYSIVFGTFSVKDPTFGAVGDGIADDTNAIQTCLDTAFGSSGAPHEGGASVYLNREVYFPPGNYRITAPLNLKRVVGGHIFGAGRFVTKIENVTANGSVFITNGCQYSRFERMLLTSNGTGTCFELDWDGAGATCALQSNTFSDMYTTGGSYGLRIGATGNMGSETSVFNCFFNLHTVAGLRTNNGNALQQSIFGGNFQSCAIGVWVSSGSCPTIHGVGFQSQTGFDIQVDNSSLDTYSILGCRTEGTSFAKIQNGASAHIAGCTQSAVGTGVFAFIEGSPGTSAGPGMLTIDSCVSRNGAITGNGHVYLRGNAGSASFGNSGYLSTFTGVVSQNI
jgi:Pectate lyase superfamily protein